MVRPSCQTFSADAVTLLATNAPVSSWWPLVTDQNASTPSQNTGAAATRSPMWVLLR